MDSAIAQLRLQATGDPSRVNHSRGSDFLCQERVFFGRYWGKRLRDSAPDCSRCTKVRDWSNPPQEKRIDGEVQFHLPRALRPLDASVPHPWAALPRNGSRSTRTFHEKACGAPP